MQELLGEPRERRTSENRPSADLGHKGSGKLGPVSRTRLCCYRKGVAVRVPEVGDLGVLLERSDALLVRDDRPVMVALECRTPFGELVDDPLDVVDVPAGQGRHRTACVIRREVDVQHAPLGAPVRYVVARVDGYREAELAFVELPGTFHVRYRKPRAHLVPTQAHQGPPHARCPDQSRRCPEYPRDAPFFIVELQRTPSSRSSQNTA